MTYEFDPCDNVNIPYTIAERPLALLFSVFFTCLADSEYLPQYSFHGNNADSFSIFSLSIFHSIPPHFLVISLRKKDL